MSGPRKIYAEAWARCRVEQPEAGDKPKEFGPPRVDTDERPFVMPADPFAALRGAPEPAESEEDPEPEDEAELEALPESHRRQANGHAG